MAKRIQSWEVSDAFWERVNIVRIMDYAFSP